MLGLGNHPRGTMGTLALLCPSCWDLSNLFLVVVEPNWMLGVWSRPLLAHIFLSLPNVGQHHRWGSQSFPCHGGHR